jgi:hypothetical protein
MRPSATSLGGLKPLVYEALSLTLLAMTLGRCCGKVYYFTTVLLLLYCFTTSYSAYVSAGLADAVVSGEAVALLLYCFTTSYSVYVSAGLADAVVSGEAVALLIFARVGLVFLLLHFQLHPAGS